MGCYDDVLGIVNSLVSAAISQLNFLSWGPEYFREPLAGSWTFPTNASACYLLGVACHSSTVTNRATEQELGVLCFGEREIYRATEARTENSAFKPQSGLQRTAFAGKVEISGSVRVCVGR